MSIRFPDNRGFSLNIGRAVNNGILINRESMICVPAPHDRHRGIVLFDVCRTVLGGPVKILNIFKIKASGEKKRKARRTIDDGLYMVVPDAFARLIVQYESTYYADSTAYAGMSLQEFLMRTWGSSD